ncbi:hypothetical protein [Streptomyces sp. NPDC048410]|uniref:hypothetical protein n=1 Tax=Streptomyces sp. NPDC048410 TaxID=3365545 RepID=UPI0037164D01
MIVLILREHHPPLLNHELELSARSDRLAGQGHMAIIASGHTPDRREVRPLQQPSLLRVELPEQWHPDH